MVDSAFPSASLHETVREKLLAVIVAGRKIWAPCQGADGLWRILAVQPNTLPRRAVPSFLPLKKLLLPSGEPLWSSQGGQFLSPSAPEPWAVIGVPLCDLQAVWYLDQVFAEDLPYRARRARVLLVGMGCQPGPECRCDAHLLPLAGDLFLDQQRAWALSPAGAALLQAAGCHDVENLPLPWPEDLTAARPVLSEASFRAGAKAAIWTAEAQRCLSCGACSAVCPTCYCFDVLDDAALDGSVTRRRVWDNCFFAEHGKVAGGHDFRPGRAERLRFRMEHKFFGFGSLRGQNSCVGCGRCRQACPVDIDLDRIATELVAEAGS